MNGLNWKRILIGSLIGLVSVIVILSLYILRMDFRWSDSHCLKEIEKHSKGGQIIYDNPDQPMVRAIETGAKTAPAMVFIHGTPGSSRDFSRYLFNDSLQTLFRMIALDRPGYGGSQYGKVMPSVLDQAGQLMSIIPDSSIIVGHSYGGPVAAAIAARYPEKVKHLVLLAAAVDPSQEKYFLINRIIGIPPMKWILSGAMRVAVAEKLTHETALDELLPYWSKIDQPVTIVHGENDNIVPYENMAFLIERLTKTNPTTHQPEGMNHIMIWSMDNWVTDLLLDMRSNP